jgi:single-strand DNA-binding protein
MAGFNINVVVISGNLTRDPELRSLPSGNAVCDLGIAVNERIKDPHTNEWTDRPNYFDVAVWGGMGEWCARSLHKGSGVTIEGRLRWESWERDGQKRSKVSITANSVVPRDGDGGGQRQQSQSFSDVPAPAPTPVPSGPAADDDIPF